jgi:hypothetical protein
MPRAGAMKYNVKQFKSLKIALKELEPYIRNGQHLETGKPFKILTAFGPGRYWRTGSSALPSIRRRSLTG